MNIAEIKQLIEAEHYLPGYIATDKEITASFQISRKRQFKDLVFISAYDINILRLASGVEQEELPHNPSSTQTEPDKFQLIFEASHYLQQQTTNTLEGDSQFDDWNIFFRSLMPGSFIRVTGNPGLSKKGEPSLYVYKGFIMQPSFPSFSPFLLFFQAVKDWHIDASGFCSIIRI